MYGQVPFSPRSGNVTRFSGFAVGAGPLWAPLGACGPGPCGLHGPLWAGPLWPPGPLWAGALQASWALVGRALVCPLGHFGLSLGPLGP